MTNVEEAVKWLSYTYLYVRMRINPLVYGIPYNSLEVTAPLFSFVELPLRGLRGLPLVWLRGLPLVGLRGLSLLGLPLVGSRGSLW